MNLKYLSIISSIGGIILLYILSLYAQVPLVLIENVEEHEGAVIMTNGTVIDHVTTTYGNQLITIKDNNSTLILFIENPIEIQKGDILQATGTVQRYKNDWELIVDKTENIDIIQSWNNATVEIRSIAQNPTKYVNQNVNLSGYVDLIFDDYFYLVDEDKSHFFIVKKPYAYNTGLYTGQKIILKAFFTYDPTQTRYIFDLRSEDHIIIPFMEPAP